jgi:hypothetical protein
MHVRSGTTMMMNTRNRIIRLHFSLPARTLRDYLKELMAMTTQEPEWKVGSVVRLSRSNSSKVSSKAMIATFQNDSNVESACLLWEPLPPRPFSAELSKPFLISPYIAIALTHSRQREDVEEEITVSVDQLKGLFPFETEDHTNDINHHTQGSIISLRKEQGDELLRCGDSSSAVSYYEEALRVSSKPSIGSSIIVKVQGYPKIAEVDYMEDDGSMDITLIESEEETTVSMSSVLLTILQPDPDQFQERILLNLARCMLHLADLDTKHRPKYLKAAVLACTLAMTICEFQTDPGTENDDSNGNSTVHTALFLRAKTQGFLSKWPNAMADAKRLIQAGKQEQGNKLLENLQKRKQQMVKKDKKLAKAVAKFVSNVTTESEELLVSDQEGHPAHPESRETQERSSKSMKTNPTTKISLSFLSVMMALVAAILIQKMIG